MVQEFMSEPELKIEFLFFLHFFILAGVYLWVASGKMKSANSRMNSLGRI
jgi:uncharacterized membrane protein (DUF485 family)